MSEKTLMQKEEKGTSNALFLPDVRQFWIHFSGFEFRFQDSGF